MYVSLDRMHTVLKVLTIVGVCLLLAAIGFSMYTESGRNESVPVSASSASVPAAGAAERTETVFDSDTDGLRDWEEALWRTDPKEPDSDRDGTGDGDEVLQGRDPRKKGPDDRLALIPAVREGVAPVPATVRNVTRPRVEAEILDTGFTPPRKNEPESPLRTFGNALGELIQRAAENTLDEMAFLNTAAGKTRVTPELLQGFSKLQAKYRALAEEIARLQVPPEASNFHEEVAAGYRVYASALGALAQGPLGEYLSSEALFAYSSSTLAIARAIVENGNFFSDRGIFFQPSEPGFIFMFPKLR